ncbi:tetratricopeptide repeat protein [Methylobacter sp.]|uniref:tetratricopeptide repeat protein n=1 Tax=Methylobacter sp. TaxID=2051955 RepID=UPI002FDD46BD
MTANTPPQQTLSLTIEQALDQAIEHHQAGQLQDAEQLYRAILQVQPNHPEANHNLGTLAVQSKQPLAGLSHFMTALEADPTHLQYWLSYIDTLIQAGMPDAARQVLALGQQQGILGDQIDALAVYLQGDTELAAQSNTEDQHAFKEPQPVPEKISQHRKKKSKTKPPKPGKPNRKPALLKENNPSPEQINTLAALFNEGRNAEAATLAQTMTVNFPLHGFGWMVLGLVLQQMGRLADALTPMQKAAELSPDDDEAHYNLGNTLKNLGKLNEAEASYRRALQIKPNDAETHYNLGNTLKDLRRLPEAVDNYRQALQARPNYAEAYNNLGVTFQDMGRLDEAEAGYRQALLLKPDYAEAYSNLGIILKNLGRLDEAEASYRKALQIKPDYAEAYNNLGATLQKMDRLNEAEAGYRQALLIKPDYAEAHNNIGIVLYDLGRLDEAEACYRQALLIKPDCAEAYNSLGSGLKNKGLVEEAEASYRQALQIKPDYAEAHNNLGTVLKVQGRLNDAKACYRKASELGIHSARILDALILPAIIGTRQEMLQSRAEFERNLDELIKSKVTLDDPVKHSGENTFYLAYHGLNDRDLQVKVAKYYEQACPALLYDAPHCAQPKSGTPGKTRVGFLSKFLYSHSVSLCFSKIIESLSLEGSFETALISSHPIDDKIYSGFIGKRLQLPNNLILAREMIAELELDILVYLDIGMDPLCYFLAFSRLARIQCVLPGHPVTTGITNMDYFLSTDLMEPFDAENHYSEKLVRLPRPTFYFERPTIPATFKSRDELNLPNGRRIYMCPVKLQKIHPDFDDAITRILQIDDNGVVVLFEDDIWPYWKKALIKRFESTIPAEIRDRILFLPWLKNPNDFISVIASADVILDPFHFGIGSTASMIFATNTPLVTKAGEFMRGRGGAFYCEILDLMECIAEDTESYAEKAVAIANNQFLREQISAKILQNSHIIYGNLQPIQDLTDFFHSLTEHTLD